MSLFLLIAAPNAFAAEKVRGAGIREAINIVENVSRDFNKKNPEIRVTHKELPKTDEVVKNVGTGEREYGLINRALNAKEKELYPDMQTYLFAKDGIVFVVHPDNPLKAITTDQVKSILQAKTTDWFNVGGKKGVISMLILRDKKAVERTAVEKYVLGKDKMAVGKIREVGNLRGVRGEVELDNSALGYLLMSGAGKKVKALELDGLAPKKGEVKAGNYPLAVQYFFITKGDPSPNMQKFMDFIYSPEGGKLVEKGKVSFIAKKTGQ
jgi:phosphate transport system substrate-binding protein